MKVLVVGTGSIGTRHIANLVQLGVDVHAYSYRTSKKSLSVPHPEVRLVNDVRDALEADFDAVVIANRTDLHMEIALKAAKAGKNFFIEKPISASLAGTEELLTLVERNKLVVEAGFMLRCHPNLLWIKEYLANNSLGDLMHLRASAGQWLPDWRPETDHRTSYSAIRKTGGGVIFDLIHELDLVYWLAGKVVDVNAITRYVESLEIETEAIAQIGLRFDSGAIAQVHLDYVRPGYGRDLEIVGTQGVLYWNYLRGTVTIAKSDGSMNVMHCVPQEFERNNMFENHMSYFLRRLSSPELGPTSPLVDSINVMRIALACHQSAEGRRCVRPDEIDSHFEPTQKFPR
jgi:predicted dehydrogenase